MRARPYLLACFALALTCFSGCDDSGSSTPDDVLDGTACAADACPDLAFDIPDGACVPDCAGRECGDDGCGDKCGQCVDSFACTAEACVDGVCAYPVDEGMCLGGITCAAAGDPAPGNPCRVCDPTLDQDGFSPVEDGVDCGQGRVCFEAECCDPAIACADAVCGDDGCGGSCGECDPGFGCVRGACEGPPFEDWVRVIGGAESDLATSVAVDATGNVYVGGWFESTAVALDDDTWTNSTDNTIFSEGFVLALGSDGAVRWSQPFGAPRYDRVSAVAVGAEGLWIGGQIEGTVSVGGVDSPGDDANRADAFVSVLDPADGTATWVTRFTGSRPEDVRSIAALSGGGAVVAGFTESVDDPFGIASTSVAGFAVRVDAAGQSAAAIAATSDQYTALETALPLADGSTIVFGRTLGDGVSVGGAAVDTTEQPGFVARLDPAGTMVWSLALPASASADTAVHPQAALLPNGNVVIATGYHLPWTHGALSLPAPTSTAGYVMALDADDGTPLWATPIDGEGIEVANVVTSDAAGDVYVAGVTESRSLTIHGGLALDELGDNDVFVAKFSGVDGAPMWADRHGGSASDIPLGIAVDATGRVTVVGFTVSATFAAGSLERDGNGRADAFVLSLTQ